MKTVIIKKGRDQFIKVDVQIRKTECLLLFIVFCEEKSHSITDETGTKIKRERERKER